MQIILNNDVRGLGKGGDIVKVADGYARNYLIPRGLAFVATDANRKAIEARKRDIEARMLKIRTDAESLAKRLRDITLTFSVKVGENDHLYGSVSARDIEKSLADKGIALDHKAIQLDEPIKSLGEFDINIELHGDVACAVKVLVKNEAEAA